MVPPCLASAALSNRTVKSAGRRLGLHDRTVTKVSSLTVPSRKYLLFLKKLLPRDLSDDLSGTESRLHCGCRPRSILPSRGTRGPSPYRSSDSSRHWAYRPTPGAASSQSADTEAGPAPSIGWWVVPLISRSHT